VAGWCGVVWLGGVVGDRACGDVGGVCGCGGCWWVVGCVRWLALGVLRCGCEVAGLLGWCGVVMVGVVGGWLWWSILVWVGVYVVLVSVGREWGGWGGWWVLGVLVVGLGWWVGFVGLFGVG